jgi:hypothetical protein
MAAAQPSPGKKPHAPTTAATRRERAGFPSNAELLHELRLHGAKPPPRPEPGRVSRRARDFLLVAGLGGAVITAVTWQLLGGGDFAVWARLTLTAVGLFAGLTAFIFFGVMGRY